MSSRYIRHVLIIGAGPIGLLLGCILRDQGMPVTIMDKRTARTRERRVKLSGQVLRSELIYDGIYLFTKNQLEERQRANDTISNELSKIINNWLELYTPINQIQDLLRTYFLVANGVLLEGLQYDLSQKIDLLQHYHDTLVVDCTGYNSVLRDSITPSNRIGRIVEHALICTFFLNDQYQCNELCKYYKNKNIQNYHVIPSISNTYIDGERRTFVTCIITIDAEEHKTFSTIRTMKYEYLKEHHPLIYQDLRQFLLNLTSADLRKVNFETMEFIALPLNLYRSVQLTRSNNELNQHWVLMGDAAIGGPYFQSISIGYEAVIYFAYIFRQMSSDLPGMLKKYEDYCEKLWLKLQFHSKEIEKNKQILQALCRKDNAAILNFIKIY